MNLQQASSQRCRIRREEFQTCIADHLAQTSNVSRYHDPSSHHLLHGSKAGGLFTPGRHHDYLDLSEDFFELGSLQLPCKRDSVLQAQTASGVLKFLSLRSIADESEVK